MSEAFDSATAKTMASALSLVMDRLGVELTDVEEARSVLVRALIDAAEKGERDEQKLAVYAIEEYEKTRGDGASIGKSVN